MRPRIQLARMAAGTLMAAAAAFVPAASAYPFEPAAPQEAAAPESNTAHAGAVEPQPSVQEPLPAVRLTPEQEERARVLEGELRCPVCRSQSIRQSRSFMADDMRRKVRVMIAEGRSDAEIREYFTDRYGTWVLLTPPRSGFNLAAYILPALVVLVGAVGLALAARRWRRAAAFAENPLPPPPSRHLERLERELEEIE
jgi:cytochrome c-type biogenesis protein CcmH